MRIKSLKIPIYSGRLVLIQLEGSETLKVVTDMYKIDHDTEGIDAIAFVQRDNYVIAVGESVSPGIIAHESFHVLNYLFKDHFISNDLDNDEPGAYLLGWIVKECHKFMKL